jgi:5'-3' exonuclease
VHFEDVSKPEPEYKQVVAAFVNRARRLQARGPHVTIVLDGQRMPAKHGTDAAHAQKRAQTYAEAYEAGTTPLARVKCMQVAVAITPRLVSETVAALRRANITYFVSPYEGDSQLKALDQLGLVDCIFTIGI